MNVLIIDDEDSTRSMLQSYVEFRGDTPLCAPDGQAGLRIFEERAVDLVITDVQMPNPDGFQVLRSVKHRRPEVPVIMITAYADKDRAIQAVNDGAFAMLQKPIRIDELSAKVDEAFRLLRSHREGQARLQSLRKITQDQFVALERERAFSQAILRNAPFPICLIDRENRIRMANPAFREGFSCDRDEVEGQELEKIVRGIDLSGYVAQELAESFSDVCIEVRSGAEGEGAEARYFQVRGFPIDLLGPDAQEGLTCLLMQDVTLRVKMEREQALRQWCLKQLYEFRELTAPVVPSGNLLEDVTRRLADIVGHFNEALVRLIYRSHAYVSGSAVTCDQPYLIGHILIHGERQGRLEFFSPSPRFIDLQREFVDDLVEALARRVEAREFELHIIHSGQLSSLGEMAAGVAHELNQPLSGIRTFAEGTLYGLEKGWETSQGELRQTFQDIIEQADRMTAIIDHMRTFSRDSSEEDPVPFQIGEVIQGVFKLVGTQMKVHGVTVNVDAPEGLPECRGWPQQIEQVLLNLITNARQAMDERAGLIKPGKASADSRWTPVLEVRARIEKGGDRLRVEVTDTGGGVPEEILPRIFEPFFTSKEAGKGTGLGLSISRGIVQKHGGTIEVANRPGIGATFSVVLPVEPQ